LNYKDYQSARDAAWRILLDCGVDHLPVRTSVICKALGVRLVEGEIAQDGYSTVVKGVPYIVVKQSLSNARKRFTVAHELGHIILGHVGRFELVNREPDPEDNTIEQAANVFASRLLAPACVLWGCQVESVEEIAQLCGISTQAAGFRWERMQELNQRNKFLVSPLERQVYECFLPFISNHRQLASSDRASTEAE